MDDRFTFKKPERISSQKEIDRLFSQGASFVSYPLRVAYLYEKPASGATISVLVGVPKKKIKSAVERNRIKRLVREAYRLNKTPLLRCYRKKGICLMIAIIFIGNELFGWEEIDAAMQKVLTVLLFQSTTPKSNIGDNDAENLTEPF